MATNLCGGGEVGGGCIGGWTGEKEKQCMGKLILVSKSQKLVRYRSKKICFRYILKHQNNLQQLLI